MYPYGANIISIISFFHMVISIIFYFFYFFAWINFVRAYLRSAQCTMYTVQCCIAVMEGHLVHCTMYICTVLQRWKRRCGTLIPVHYYRDSGNPLQSSHLLAPTGALLVMVVYYKYIYIRPQPLFEILSISANIFSFSF